MLVINQLKEFLPNAGMVLPSSTIVLGMQRRDTGIMKAFEVANFAEAGTGPTKAAKAAVDQALAQTFILATSPQMMKELCGEGGGVLHFLGVLRTAVPWAERVGESTFIKFCQCLVDARLAWKKNPRPPFNIIEHSATARAIDDLLEAAGPKWCHADFEIYALVGGFEEDEENDKEEEGGEASGANQAGESSSSAGPSDSTDIEMTDLAEALEEDSQEEELRRGMEEMDLDD
ncbi:hypothetical protein F5Y05DRAFT_413466 [Hypoxylon sp. FL0543]|nr:hypothetical protein F5Y05DRAFT_413466 [Hypoxylon sp. FL0543]